jgi:hypothetical protein
MIWGKRRMKSVLIIVFTYTSGQLATRCHRHIHWAGFWVRYVGGETRILLCGHESEKQDCKIKPLLLYFYNIILYFYILSPKACL